MAAPRRARVGLRTSCEWTMQDLGHAQAGEMTWQATADVRISAGHRPAGGRTGQPGTMVGIRASRCDRRLNVGKPCNPCPDLP
jgi:hypothetical protein